jgi:hypothetical protein
VCVNIDGAMNHKLVERMNAALHEVTLAVCTADGVESHEALSQPVVEGG